MSVNPDNAKIRIFQVSLNEEVRKAREKNLTVKNEESQIIVVARALVGLLNHAKRSLQENKSVIQVAGMDSRTAKQTPIAHIIPTQEEFRVLEYSPEGEMVETEVTLYLKELLFHLLRADANSVYDAFRIVSEKDKENSDLGFYFSSATLLVEDFLTFYENTNSFEDDATIMEWVTLPQLLNKLKNIPINLEVVFKNKNKELFKIVNHHGQSEIWLESVNGDLVKEVAVTQLLERISNFGGEISFEIHNLETTT